MKGLDCRFEAWYVDDELSEKLVAKVKLPDFRGEDKECLHLRGRGWRWLVLKKDFADLEEEEYVLSFWGKFDYYSGNGTRCFVGVYESREDRNIFEINPNCQYAVARAGGWYLYKIPVKFQHGRQLRVEIVSFEANLAVLEARPEDEKDPLVAWLSDKEKDKSYSINEELPYREYDCLEQRIVKYYSNLLAPYYPTKEIEEAGQAEYYEFVKGLYHKLFTRPEDYFSRLNVDDAFPNRFNQIFNQLLSGILRELSCYHSDHSADGHLKV